MSYPAGNLPNAGAVADFQRFTRPSKSLAFTGSGSDVDLTTSTLAPCAIEFFCTTSGTFIAQLVGDSATQNYGTVAAGATITGVFGLIKGTSTASGILRA